MNRLITLAVLLGMVFTASGDTYTVTNTSNSGAGSLRQAIDDSNSHSGHDTIEFNIPGAGPFTISPTSGYNSLNDRVTIDGYSQPGALRATDSTTALLMVELDGSSAGSYTNAFYFFTNSDSSRVCGLVINRFTADAIYLLNPKGVQIEGNYIGTDVTGTTAQPNHGNGIIVEQESSNGTIIGGTSPGERNVLSGNLGNGVSVVMTNNCVISGNYIGTDATGSNSIPNSENGIHLYGDYSAVTNNLISGNSSSGIYNQSAQHSEVQGNYIGTNSTGTAAVPNEGHGIKNSGDYTTIGGSSEDERNVISGNAQQGINFTGSTHNTIIGNYIGTNASGTAAIPNKWSAMCFTGSSNNNIIGGTGTGEGNLISGNTVNGIDIQGCTGFIIEGNLIGTDVTGMTHVHNGYSGISLSAGAHGNTIGGATAQQRNIISGNHVVGITIDASNNNTVEGNYIGVNSTGSVALSTGYGINISGGSTGNSIGGGESGQGNIISGNTYGMFVSGCSGNTIEGNYIGTDVTGTAALGNLWAGIYFYDNGSSNTVGGTDPGQGNLISGNSHHGIRIEKSTGNILEGNLIGTTISGKSDLGNGAEGIYLLDASHSNIIGGTDPGAGNIIAFNEQAGICVNSDHGNSILSNSIFSNAEMGIDLGGDGVTANDPDDPDLGANKLQNFPEIISISVIDSELEVTYIVPSLPANSAYPLIIEFFVANEDQGETLLDLHHYQSPDTVTVTIESENPYLLSDYLIATATDADGNTSEFGAPFPIRGGIGSGQAPEEFDLSIAGPNPGHGSIALCISIPVESYVRVNLYDLNGRIVKKIMDGTLVAGTQTVQLRNLIPGIYFCRMESGQFLEVERMVIIE